MEEYEVVYENRYSFDSSEEGFIKGKYDNLYCDQHPGSVQLLYTPVQFPSSLISQHWV